MTKDCMSCVHAQRGFIINTLHAEENLDRCRQKRRWALCSSSAAAAVAIDQLQLQLSRYSLIVLQAF